MTTKISVLVTPRDPNPYQELLYEGVANEGVRVQYAQGPTPSQSLNLILAPVLLVWYRFRGFRILHIHWTFQFSLPWARQERWARSLMEWWFRLYLLIATLLHYRIVWTAHDLIPYDQIFNDDVWARDKLIAKSRAIVALSKVSALELNALGAKNVTVIPFGSYVDPYPVTITRDDARASFGFDPEDFVVILMGRVERYKGADLLLRAALELPPTSRIRVMIAGSCTDEAYKTELIRLAQRNEERILLSLEWIPEEELARYLRASDIAAFPFRDITNSSSVALAQSFALPVVIPDVPMLRDVPSESAIRYLPQRESQTDSLVAALTKAEDLSKEKYHDMSTAASAWAHSNDWSSVARQMTQVYERVLGAKK